MKLETEMYIRFVKLLKIAVEKSIPREHRTSYTSCWTKEYKVLLKEYEKYGTEVNAHRLIWLLDEERRKMWLEAMQI